MNLQNVELGPLAAWLSALLTSGTLFMSLRLYRRDWRDRRRDQARKVNAWVDLSDFGEGSVLVSIKNASDSPAYNAHVSLYALHRIHPFYYKWVAMLDLHTIPPTSDPVSRKISVSFPEAAKNPPISVPRAVVVVGFTDTAGVGWSRSPSGELIEAKRDLVRNFLMNRYGMWPPIEKKDKWWVKTLTYLYFPDQTLASEDYKWKWIRTPEEHRAQLDTESAEMLKKLQDRLKSRDSEEK